MKKVKKVQLPKPWVRPPVSPEEQYARDVMYARLQRLGIDVFSFDSGFESAELNVQLEKDKSLAWACIIAGKDVPSDVEARLLAAKAAGDQGQTG